jgi:molecular chaperone DnaK
VSEANKAPILASVEKLKKAKDGNDLNALKSAFGELEQAAHAMAMAQAQAQQGASPGPQGGGQAPPTGKKEGDDVVDAEFEVK